MTERRTGKAMTTLNETKEALLRRVSENPQDWQTRLVLADFLEEECEDEGEALYQRVRANGTRWQVKNGKKPRNWSVGPGPCYDWWHGPPHEPHDLPEEVYNALTAPESNYAKNSKDYVSEDYANADLAWALHKLGVKA